MPAAVSMSFPMNSQRLPRRRFLAIPASLAALPLARAQSQSNRASEAPAKPAISVNIRDFGAKGDGAAKDTAAIQQAIDRCSVLGGGEVLAPAGNYLTCAIALRSNVLLRLDRDATISGSPDFADYPVSQVRWEGKWIPGHVGLIYAIDSSRIGIVGPGKIAGNPPWAVGPLRKIHCVIRR
jgi:polygalacturonase